MIIELAGLLAAAGLLMTLVALEVRRTVPDTGQPTRKGLLSRRVSRWAVAAMWTMYLFLFLPRVLGLLA
ncbi:hypothetical protein [Arthrobacter sp. ISL-65]|uniref:hypothetical protein n=1 Tax=Arthrobacter sp. ISL-65 TaxID=2819112 RepID=UPI001BE543C7|nr:hypothetical protein [Arthrobacter sp. ISL-65]MBT2547041.1 hypothetical protein [Arthrobacter sp. ISL-65]